MTRLPRSRVIVLLACGLAGVGCGSSSAGSPPDPFGDYGVFLSIVPPGSADVNGGVIGDDPNSLNQLTMYENLVFSDAYPTPGELSDDDLVPDYFKDEAFLPESAFDAVETLTDGAHTARIGRDDFGVPHIFGDTREDLMFGTGYATATDRMFLVDVIRHFGRGRMSDFLGPSDSNYSTDRGLGTSAGYSEQELQEQIDQIAVRLGVDGPQAQQDLDDFVDGINQYIEDVTSGRPGRGARSRRIPATEPRAATVHRTRCHLRDHPDLLLVCYGGRRRRQPGAIAARPRRAVSG